VNYSTHEIFFIRPTAVIIGITGLAHTHTRIEEMEVISHC